MAQRSFYDHCRLLDKKSIRLIHIVRTSPVPVLSLHPYGIAEAPDYYALSYTWGNPLPPLATGGEVYKEVVSCILTSEDSEYNVSITRNLSDALCSLAKNSINGPLWIDAVCINRDDTDERQEQVTMMGQIYASAEEVIAWLGLASDLDKDAVILHNEFIPALRRHFGGSLPAPEDLEALSLSHLLELNLVSDPQALKSYAWFRWRAWFQRAWTFQEAFLARKITILYDDHTINWCDLTDFARYDLYLHETVIIQGRVPEIDQLGTLPFLRSMEDLRATFGIGSQDNPIRSFFNTHGRLNSQGMIKRESNESHLLLVDEDGSLEKSRERIRKAYFLIAFVRQIRHRNCMDFKDRVFAAIGSINHLFPWSCEADMLPIRYDLSVERIYESFATWILRWLPPVHILSLVEEPSERWLTGLPSWVPDLSVGTRLDALTDKLTIPKRVNKLGTFHMVTTVEGKQRLHIAGFRLGIINGVDTVPVTDTLSSYPQLLRTLFDFCRDMDPNYPSGEGRVEAVWRTLVRNSDSSSPNRLALKSLGLSFRSFILSLVTWEVLQTFSKDPVSGNWNDVSEAMSKGNSKVLLTHFGIRHCDGTESSSQEMLPSKDDVTQRILQYLNLIEKNAGSLTLSEVLNSADDDPWRFIDNMRTDGRRLFRASDGWIGLAPCSTHISDEVWSFKDSPIPYILRPSYDEVGAYSFIGGSYMHGVVAGGEPPDQQWTEVVLV
jgi:hypothetical protein